MAAKPRRSPLAAACARPNNARARRPGAALRRYGRLGSNGQADGGANAANRLARTPLFFTSPRADILLRRRTKQVGAEI